MLTNSKFIICVFIAICFGTASSTNDTAVGPSTSNTKLSQLLAHLETYFSSVSTSNDASTSQENSPTDQTKTTSKVNELGGFTLGLLNHLGDTLNGLVATVVHLLSSLLDGLLGGLGGLLNNLL
ncbi:hypothetical protein CHUAL_007884 [Chamberlinius hualienensis]